MDLKRRKSLSIIILAILISGCASNKPKPYKTETSLIPDTTSTTQNEKIKTVNDINLSLATAKNTDELQKAEIIKNEKNVLEGVAMPGKNQAAREEIYFLKDAEDLNLECNYFDIPVIYNAQVKKWIEYFTHKGRAYFKLYIERAGRYAPTLGLILEKNGLPRDLIFLAMAESGFNNLAKSRSKAVGPWQFMPATGKSYNLDQNYYVDERKDPIKATDAAAQYLSKLYGDFGEWEIATAAYNAGEGKLGRAIKKYKTTNFWHLSKGKYLKNETKNYVPKIMALAIIGKNLKTFGFNDINFYDPLDFDEARVKPQTDIEKLSKELKINVSEIERLNPELLRWFTPPHVKNYKLRLPPNSLARFKLCCSNKDAIKAKFQEYKIKKKKVKLSDLSKKFQINNAYVLAHLNSVSINSNFHRGEKVKIPFRIGEKITLAKIAKPTKKKKKRSKKLYHIVKKGESLHRIAKAYKVSIKKLTSVNKSVASSKVLMPGTKLVIR